MRPFCVGAASNVTSRGVTDCKGPGTRQRPILYIFVFKYYFLGVLLDYNKIIIII